MIWFVLAGMAALAALAAVWPLLRGSSPSVVGADPAASAAGFYRAQLAEIERDVARGQLPRSEAANARAEAARRLIAAHSAEGTVAAPRARNRLAAAVLIACGLPAIAFPLYAYIGRPQAPDEPLASRNSARLAASDIEAAVAGVEAHLIAKPDDGKGWAVIAPVYMRLERYADAAHAYAEALRLLGEDASRRSAYGEALFAAAGGIITDQARAAFERALTDRPQEPQARFYLALAAEQDGKKEEAVRAYESLIADSPPDAHWLAVVKARLAALTGEAPPQAGSGAGEGSNALGGAPEGQRAAIEGMVSRLADRLAANGGSADEWARLIRAYTVLHQDGKAKAALADARKALAPDAGAVAGLDALARDLGLGDAN
ncbi:MAG: c-type cytochrome biogenesis protein CcmI [Hyphomicrobiales bacterium]|nr:c-type cytochrome biogenesis protein CcmI [Hyphomicrobiales bacterium]